MTRHLPLAALAVLLGLSLFAGLRGVDFGRHWDERHLVQQATTALKTELLLPRSYHYPSVPFWLTTAALAVGDDAAAAATSPSLRPDGQRTAVPPPPAVAADPILRIRSFFLIFSAFIGLWTYLAGRAAGLRSWPAVLGAGLVVGSFELAYHQRWIAPDAVMAQLAALTLWLLLRARLDARWLLPAAVAAGLCCGTKYTGGLLLVGVLFVAVTGPAGRLRRALLGGATFAASYLATTPGTLLDHGLFWRHLTYEIEHYAQGHGSYSVDGFASHLALAGRWLADSALAPWPLLAVGLAALALFGAGVVARPIRVWRGDGRRFLLLGLPLLYLLFMARQRVFITRNLLILLPFVAILAAVASQALLDRLRPGGRRWVVGGLLALPVAANLGFQLHASQTIHNRRTPQALAAFTAWCAAHPELAAHASPRLQHALGGATGACLTTGAARAYALYLSEGQPDSRRWPTLGEAWPEVVFGPVDVNLRWYGSWLGDDRIVVVDRATAERLHVAVP